MTFTKKEILRLLEQIRIKNNIDIDKYINDVFDNQIPIKSLKFINLYIPLDDLGVFNLIYSKRHKTPLFKNFKKGNIDNYEQVICLSSLLTQMLCYIKTTKENVIKHSILINSDSIIKALDHFMKTGKFDEVNKVYIEISSIFKELYNKDGD